MARNRGIQVQDSNRENRTIVAQPAELVPRVVHQVWVQGEPTGEPAVLIGRVRDICRKGGWGHCLWSQSDDGGLQCSQARSSADLYAHLAPRCLNLSVRSDLARFVILAEFGGLYLDCDVDLYKLPEGLAGAWIWETCPSRVRPSGHSVVNCAVMAQPVNHPFLGRVLASIVADQAAFAADPIAGPGYCQRQMGADVQRWPTECWQASQGRRAVYGEHLYRCPQWGSQKPIG